MPTRSRRPSRCGHRRDEPARVRVRGGPEQLVRRRQLDDPAGVHDGDAGGERADDGQVVADVERRHLVRGGQLAHGAEHVRLGGDVEAGRRLVQHDHARPAGERHREADALLLAARELVRVAAQVRPRRQAARPRASSRRCAPAAPRRRRRSRAPRAPRISCVPMRSAGLSAAAGSCGTYETTRPRRRAALGPGRASARPGRRPAPTRPRSRRRGGCGRAAPAPTVVLPEPDSPTRPSTSPGAIANETSSTMSSPVPRTTTRRPSTTIAGVGGAHSAPRRPVDARSRAREPVADEARADREQGDRDHRQHDAPGLIVPARPGSPGSSGPSRRRSGSGVKPRNASDAISAIA